MDDEERNTVGEVPTAGLVDRAVPRWFAIRPQSLRDEGSDFGVPGAGEIKLLPTLLFPQKAFLHQGMNAGRDFLAGEVGIRPVYDLRFHRAAWIAFHQKFAHPVENIFV